MNKNILVIGTYSAEGIDSFDWWQELPNLSDYDTIILDTTRILNFWSLAGRLKQKRYNVYSLSRANEQDKRINSNLNLIRQKLLEILEFDVTVYALYAPDVTVSYQEGGYKRLIYINNWCPIDIDTVSEKGKKIVVNDQSYAEFFKNFKGWEYYFEADSLKITKFQGYYERWWKVLPRLGAIASNKTERPIAVRFTPRFHFWRDTKHTDWLPNPEKIGGSLVLLPTTDMYDTWSLIEILLRRGKIFEETPQPTWVDKIEIPGEASLKDAIATETKKLEAVQAEIKKREDSFMELKKHKRLLYATGPELQDICKSTLEQLGAKTKPSDVTDEFIIEIEDKEALVEVKGNEKSIHKRDISQLITDRGQYLATTDQYVKGILIGNAWRRSHPQDRDIKGKPIFARHVVEIAEDQNIGLVSTTELFKAYCKRLQEPQCKTEILNKIISGKGIIKF